MLVLPTYVPLGDNKGVNKIQVARFRVVQMMFKVRSVNKIVKVSTKEIMN